MSTDAPGPIYAARLPVRRDAFADQLQPATVPPPGHDWARERDADLTIHPDEEGWTYPLYVQAVEDPHEVALMIGETPGAVVLNERGATELRDFLTAWLTGAETDR